MDVYPMFCAIADRIQLESRSPLDALDATLAIWSQLLARRKRLSDDQEIGLFGELLLLRALVVSTDESDAVASWRGPLAEEHDFGFGEIDAEIKTTTAEVRRHWINGLTQLVPTEHRTLWLVSVQITRAGAGHGESLPELIDAVRSLLRGDESRRLYDETLSTLRWSDRDRDLYPQRWTLRSTPRAFQVGPAFPTLTSESLVRLGLLGSEIIQVRYEINLTHRDDDEPSEPLASALRELT